MCKCSVLSEKNLIKFNQCRHQSNEGRCKRITTLFLMNYTNKKYSYILSGVFCYFYGINCLMFSKAMLYSTRKFQFKNKLVQYYISRVTLSPYFCKCPLISFFISKPAILIYFVSGVKEC